MNNKVIIFTATMLSFMILTLSCMGLNYEKKTPLVSTGILHHKKLSNGKIFYYKMVNDTLIQKISITFLTKSKISYKIYSHNIRTNETDSIDGYAIANLNVDPEIDEDVNGDAYPSIKFDDNDKDFIEIRLSLGKSDKIQILADDEKYSKHPQKCPFTSQSILYKVKNK